MEIGVMHIVQNFYDRHTDQEVMERSLKLAELYEPAGFDFCLTTEHHFHGYTMAPVPFDFLSYLAAKTSRMRIGPGVIIVPWNDPYRAASHMISLDYLSGGRAILGLGRGLSQIEMDLFGIDMNETRAMFDEGSAKIVEALTTGSYPGGGQFYNQQSRSPMRPAPRSTKWLDRMLCVGMSPGSALSAAQLGGRLMCFGSGDYRPFREASIDPYLAKFRETHGREPGPIVVNEGLFVHDDRERAFELASEYLGNLFDIVEEFYSLSSSRLDNVSGYEAYAAAAKQTAHMAHAEKRKAAVELSLFGTPSDILEKLRDRRQQIGHPFDLCAQIDGGDIPLHLAEDCIRMVSEKIIPVVRQWDATAAAAA